jgi:hypothetical protein
MFDLVQPLCQALVKMAGNPEQGSAYCIYHGKVFGKKGNCSHTIRLLNKWRSSHIPSTVHRRKTVFYVDLLPTRHKYRETI